MVTHPVLLQAPATWNDIIGKRFDRLTVLGYTGEKASNGQKRITCVCDCGNYVHAAVANVRRGATTSCGCRRSEVCAARNVENQTHGASVGGKVTREYAAWQAMKNRCDPRHVFYRHYGGRGITICARWLESFENFLADVGPRPSPAHSLDRINNDGNYEPSNVRWATQTEQVRNRRGMKLYEFKGERLVLPEIAARTGVPCDRLRQRIIRYGWTLAEAVSTPVGREVHDLYGRWYQIVQRCTNPEHERFADYGGRGIRVCEEWLLYEQFVADVGEPPSPDAYMLDRINNERGYEPGNVRWATPTTQSRNRRGTRLHELDRQKHPIAEWCRLADADCGTVSRRVHSGWSLTEALGTPRNAGRSVRSRVAWIPSQTLQQFNNTHVSWASASAVDQQQLVESAVRAYRAHGFPWETLTGGEEEPLQAVARGKVSVEGNLIRYAGPEGQRTCLGTHHHRLEARHGNQHSALSAFDDDEVLKKAITYQLSRGFPITPLRLSRTVMAFVRAPRNFPPTLARWIVDEYAPDGGTVYDPCSGYGGRLLGALASRRGVTYTGADVEPKSAEANVELAARVGCSSRARQLLQSVEDSAPWPRADLVLTGPPYYDTENYGIASQTSLLTYPTYASWRDGFLKALVTKALAAAPVVVINVAAVNSGRGRVDIPADVEALAGGWVVRILDWPLKVFGKKGRVEKVLVLRRKP